MKLEEMKCKICKGETEDYIENNGDIICSECQQIDWNKICYECHGRGGNCPSCGGSGHGLHIIRR